MSNYFSGIDLAKSQAIYQQFVSGKVITQKNYDLYQKTFIDNPLYTALFNHLDFYTTYYQHMGFKLNFNVDGAFFYISRSEMDEDADTNATKIQAILLIIARYWVDKGFDLDDLSEPNIGFGRETLDEIADKEIYNNIRQAINIENWDRAISYLVDRNFLFLCGDKHYILSSAGMHFLNLHIEKYKKFNEMNEYSTNAPEDV